MTKSTLKTAEIFPDDNTKIGVIETLAGCVYVISNELGLCKKVEDVPPVVGYHLALGLNLLGAILGRISPQETIHYDLSHADADYDQKLEVAIEALIRLRDKCRQTRKNET